MAHAGQEIGFGKVGFFRRGFRSFQLDVVFLLHLLEAFAFGDVARGGEDALQFAVAVVEGGRVIGDHGFFAVAGARREFVIGDFAVAQDALDACLGALRIGEVILERRADQLIAGAAR